MIYEYKCEKCGRYQRAVRSNKVCVPRFCSIKCRGCTKKFQWGKLSEEEKKQHIRRVYESKVVRSDNCWDWKAAKDKNGYGRMTLKAGITHPKAHQVSWYLTHGDIPKGLCVLHKCDNPICSNPAHLFLGTHLDNTRDMISKNRDNFRGLKRGRSHFRKHVTT